MTVKSVIQCAVKTTDASFSTESYKVGAASVGLTQIPVLMGPHLACLAESGSSLVNDERNALTFANSPNFLVKQGGCLSVAVGCNGFNDNCANISMACTLFFYDFFESFNASCLFCDVLMLVDCERILKDWQRCDWPVVSRNVSMVNCLVTAA